MDDDLEGIYKLQSEIKFGVIKKTLAKKPPEATRQFFQRAFNTIEKNNTKLWGIYPVYNPFYMSSQISNKGFVIGSLCGIINSDIEYQDDLPLKEDYAFTIDHILKYKKIARYDYITIKAKHYTNKGGCVDLRKDKEELEYMCCQRMLNKYPQYVKLNPKRKNEILLNF